MIELGRRQRNQPAPAWAIFAALVDPDERPERAWLQLVADECRPRILRSRQPSLVVWSSLWPTRPDVEIHFDLPPDGPHDTALQWTLFADQNYDESAVGHMRYRLNTLINAELRYSFGH